MSLRDDNTRRATAQASPALSRRAFVGLAGLAGAGLVTGCSSGLKGSTSSTTGTIKIGFVSPMTGPDAAFATANPFVLKKVLCSWEPPFANFLAGAPGSDYLSRGIVDCRGAPTADAAFMGLTSCRWITISGTIAHRRRGAQPGSSRSPSRWCSRIWPGTRREARRSWP